MSETKIPKGYKKTEVGVIPEEWESKYASELCIKIQDGTHFSPVVGRGEFLYVTSKNIRFGRLDFSTAEKIDAKQHDAIYKRCDVKRGDLLLTKDGANTGNAAINDLDEEFSLLSSVAFLRFEMKIHVSSYYLQQILSSRGQSQIKELMSGNAITRLTLTKIRKLLFPVPPLPEQRAIASALSDVDALIAGLDQLIAKKRDLKQAAMQQLLTGQKRLPGFQGEWEKRTFGEIFDYHSTATNSRADLSEEFGDAYYIHYGDIHTKFHSHLNFRIARPSKIFRALCKNAALVQNGDWIMADASEDYDGVGKSIEISGIRDCEHLVAGLHTFLLREKEPTFSPGFKGHLGNLKSLHQQYLRVATGMKVYGVSKTALKDLVLAVPKLQEQAAIATILSDMDTELTVLEQRRDKTRALKQGMMQELLTGKTRLI